MRDGGMDGLGMVGGQSAAAKHGRSGNDGGGWGGQSAPAKHGGAVGEHAVLGRRLSRLLFERLVVAHLPPCEKRGAG
eukprot:5820176-Prymnesium_polylepis.1